MLLRLLTALGLTLIATGLIYINIPVWPGIAVWVALTVGIGLVLARWWALPLAAIPYPVGIGASLITGRYAYLEDPWYVIVLTTVVIGLVGIAIGILLVRLAGTLLRR